jgi:hypothetical protein
MPPSGTARAGSFRARCPGSNSAPPSINVNHRPGCLAGTRKAETDAPTRIFRCPAFNISGLLPSWISRSTLVSRRHALLPIASYSTKQFWCGGTAHS